jgi:hypothetical protein
MTKHEVRKPKRVVDLEKDHLTSLQVNTLK